MALVRTAVAGAAATTATVAGGGNNFGVKGVVALDYTAGTDFLTTKVYHGVSITSSANTDKGETGNIIGRIQSWQPDAYTREGIHLYELSDSSWGRPVEYVPGRSTGFTISVTRAEVFNAEMERAFTNSVDIYDDLQDQNKPFTIREFWFRGSASYQIWTYRGCWFQNKNIDALSADGDGVTRISGQIAYVSHRLTT